MAIISTLDIAGSTITSRNDNVAVPVVVHKEINWADVLTAKGSAIAASDVVEVIDVPAGTVVVGAWAYVKTAADSTTLTLHLGNGTDPDEYVVSLDGKTVAYSPDLNSDTTFKLYSAADTLDLTLATLTGTLTTGKVIVWAEMIYLDPVKSAAPALAALRS